MGRRHTRTRRVWLTASTLALAFGSSNALAQTPADYTTYFRWDAMRRLEMKIDPDPDGSGPRKRRVERYVYDIDGQLERTEIGVATTPNGSDYQPVRATLHRYDRVGNEVQAYADRGTPAATLTQIRYDGNDRVLCTAVRTDAAAFEGFHQAASVADACSLSGPADQIIQNTYDAAGRLLEVTRGAAALNVKFLRYEYSGNGRRTSVRDGVNNRTTLVYDGFDRLKTQYFPAPLPRGANTYNPADREEYDYDRNGNRTSLRKRDGTLIAFTFDALNRLTQKIVVADATQNVFHTYNLAGQMTSARYSSFTGPGVIFDYDSAGRQDAETSYGWAVAYELDKSGNRTKLTWPGVEAVEYAYDMAGRLSYMREPGVTSGPGLLATFTYDDLGRRTGLLRGNGGHAGYDYDAAGRLDGLTQAGSPSAPTSVQTLSYTPASQLATLAQTNTAYVWQGRPKMGNQTYTGLNQDSAFVALGSGCGTPTSGFDCNGNLTNSGVRQYRYNADNRLTRVIEGSSTFDLHYDPLGRLRATQSNSAGWTYFLHAGSQLIGEYADGAPAQPPLRRYVHADRVDEPIVWYEASDVTPRRWLHADRLGSIIAWSDQTGAIAGGNLYSYGPYGEPNDWTGSRFRYTGQAVLPEVQAYYYKARVYDPVMGRFLQTDPIGQDDDPNLYAYVKNDPINATDPTGTTIVVRDPAERERVLAWLNEESRTQFKFDEKGRLRVDKAAGVNKEGSRKASAALGRAIAHSRTISINITNDVVVKEPLSGHEWTADIQKDQGGGMTSYSGSAVFITGRNGPPVPGKNGKLIPNSAANILIHELLVHALPKTMGIGKVRSIENENAVRREQPNGRERAPDGYHVP